MALPAASRSAAQPSDCQTGAGRRRGMSPPAVEPVLPAGWPESAAEADPPPPGTEPPVAGGVELPDATASGDVSVDLDWAAPAPAPSGLPPPPGSFAFVSVEATGAEGEVDVSVDSVLDESG